MRVCVEDELINYIQICKNIVELTRRVPLRFNVLFIAT